MSSWAPNSWQQYPDKQNIVYPCTNELSQVTRTLSQCQGLVSVKEIELLKSELKDVFVGRKLLVQGGDCAESFAETSSTDTDYKITILNTIASLIEEYSHKPVIRLGRIAGQFAKPRSQLQETLNKQTLSSYRGDLINDKTFDAKLRSFAPQRLIAGYQHSQNIIAHIKSKGYWPDQRQIKAIYTSHEALNLFYEQSLTRDFAGRYYNISTHCPWIGVRTLEANSAHIEYIRGIDNPIALKIGPTITPDALVHILSLINPVHEIGKIILITRFGYSTVHQRLPQFIEAIQQCKQPVIWLCDPMHGNQHLSTQGIKTRKLSEIQAELHATLSIHQAFNSTLHGLHLEMTAREVKECLGGQKDPIEEQHLLKGYQSLVDPRLNQQQAVELIASIRQYLKQSDIQPC